MIKEKSAPITIRLTEEERKTVKRRAKRVGYSVSQYIKSKLNL